MQQIKDPELHPYFIQIDEYNYSLYKTIISSDSGKEYDMAIGHCNNMGSVLKSMIKDTMKHTQATTIKEYLTEYENVTNKLNKLLPNETSSSI